MSKKGKKQINAVETKSDLLWRKPIALDAFEDEDPLATLYRGREVGKPTVTDEEQPTKTAEKVVKSNKKRSINPEVTAETKKSSKQLVEKQAETIEIDLNESPEKVKTILSKKTTDSELKAILKIKDEFFHFTDIREILRGKSFDIYSYLRVLSGEEGFCKIKHLDLMMKLDISRPTLFKQQEWLTRLSLIEKRNVPGDHLGTSYTVHRLEEVLPLPVALIKQLETHIENFRQAAA